MHSSAIPMPVLLSAIAWQRRTVQGFLPPVWQGTIGLWRLQASHAKCSG